MLRTITLATLVAGTLDIAFAAIDATSQGGTVAGMLRSVASGPFPEARNWGGGGAALGLAVHFSIMAAMAATFVLAYSRSRWIRAHPLVAGILYGIGLWIVMYGLVLPLRFGSSFPSADPIALVKQWFAHVVLVGIVFALVATRYLRPREHFAAD